MFEFKIVKNMNLINGTVAPFLLVNLRLRVLTFPIDDRGGGGQHARLLPWQSEFGSC